MPMTSCHQATWVSVLKFPANRMSNTARISTYRASQQKARGFGALAQHLNWINCAPHLGTFLLAHTPNDMVDGHPLRLWHVSTNGSVAAPSAMLGTRAKKCCK